MQTKFITASVLAAAYAQDFYKDPYNELDIVLDGQAQPVYIAETHWTHIKDYDAPPPSDNGFTYGNACATNRDGLCDGQCSECNWSWPSNSTHQPVWDDPQANCRCKAEPEEAGDLGSGFAMGFNGRAYLSSTQMFDKTQYFMPNLLGGSMEYDVDLSEAGCACNAALYLIGMPARDREGNYRAG